MGKYNIFDQENVQEFCKRAHDLKGMFLINLVHLADAYHIDDDLLAYWIKTGFEFPKLEIETTRDYFSFDYPDHDDLGNKINYVEVTNHEEE